MSYLSRESSPLSGEIWNRIDTEVVKSAKNVLSGRRYLSIFGPLGIGVDSINIDEAGSVEEADQNGLLVMKGRKLIPIPLIYNDFTLLARDIERSEQADYPIDLSSAAASSEACALKEDRLIYYGDVKQGYTGLLTAPGAGKIKKANWSEGENAFSDVAAAIEMLASKNVYGRLALILSPDLYIKLQRLLPGTGMLEIDRIGRLVNGHIYKTPVLEKGKAVLVCAEPRNMDLVVGQDIATAYLEQKELNHSFRVLESVLLRIKRAEAIVVLE